MLGVARSSVYRQPRPVNDNDLEAMERIDGLFTARPFFGARRIARTLSEEGFPIDRKRVRRLMRHNSPLRKCRFQFAVGVMPMVTTSAAGLASMTAIRPKTSRASVCKTKMKAAKASAASRGVPWPWRARIRTLRLKPATWIR